MKWHWILGISLSVAFVGCASDHSKSDAGTKKPSAANRKTEARSQSFTAVTEKQQDNSDLNRILEKKGRAQGLSIASNPQHKSATFSTSPQAAQSSAQLYDQMVYQYEIRNWMGFQDRLTLMQQKYPTAPELADALYLAGLLQMSEKNYGKSLQYLGQVQTQFPQNHQIAAVLYSKGLIYKKMELTNLAKNMWNQVIEKYPGSPEAAKAQSEIRLVR